MLPSNIIENKYSSKKSLKHSLINLTYSRCNFVVAVLVPFYLFCLIEAVIFLFYFFIVVLVWIPGKLSNTLCGSTFTNQ